MKNLFRKPAHLFIFTTLLGSSLIFFKIYTEIVGTIIITLLCMSLIILYGIILKKTFPNFAQDQIGDNSYYLGFIFTIFSLIIALFSLYLSSEEPEKLIGYFAIGLLTTLVGISCRCFYANDETSTANFDSTTAADFMNRFTSNLDRYNLQFISIIEEMGKSAKTIGKITSTYVDHLNNVSGEISNLSSNLQENFTSIQNVVTNTFENSKQQMNEFSEGLVHLKNEISGIENFKTHIDKFNDTMPHLVKNIENLDENYKILTKHQEEMNKNVSQFNLEFLENLKTTRNDFKEITMTTTSLLSTAIKELNHE